MSQFIHSTCVKSFKPLSKNSSIATNFPHILRVQPRKIPTLTYPLYDHIQFICSISIYTQMQVQRTTAVRLIFLLLPPSFLVLQFILSSFSPPANSNPIPITIGARASTVMDTFYLSHGSPTLSIDDSIEARHFLKSWRTKVMPGVRPRAILVVSGHYDTRSPEVNSITGTTETIYDFYGFPAPMYRLKYPAPGAPDIASRVAELLKDSGFGTIKKNTKRGLDHGAWVPLLLMYPDADIPVCQLSLQSDRDATYHYNMGRALAPLRDEGVLIIGSGSATHNLRALAFDNRPPPVWASDFDNWLQDAVLNRRYDEVNHFYEKAPSAKMAQPWPDHFYPLHVAIGAAGGNPVPELIHTSWSAGSLSYTSFRFKAN